MLNLAKALTKAVADLPARLTLSGVVDTDEPIIRDWLTGVEKTLQQLTVEARLSVAARLVVLEAESRRVSKRSGDDVVPVSEALLPEALAAMLEAFQKRLEARRQAYRQDWFDLNVSDIHRLPDDLARNKRDDADAWYELAAYLASEYGAILLEDLDEAEDGLQELLRAQGLIRQVTVFLEDHGLEDHRPTDSTHRLPGETFFGLIAHTDMYRPAVRFTPQGLSPEMWSWSRIALSAEALATMPLDGAELQPTRREFREKAALIATSRIASARLVRAPDSFDATEATHDVRRTAMEVIAGWIDTLIPTDEERRRDPRSFRDADDLVHLTEIMVISIVALGVLQRRGAAQSSSGAPTGTRPA